MTSEIVTLRDASTGSQARILASYGFNCFEFRVNCDGQDLDLLWSEEGFEDGDKRPSGSGIPLLFPYPGRLRGKTLSWEGRSYELEGDNRGNAIHGYLLTRPWRITECSEQRVVAQFQASVDDPILLDRWPADFRVTGIYQLTGNSLTSEFTIENPGETPLPFGFGTHPYFRVPLGGGDANLCRVELPVSTHWESAEMLPTGKKTELANASEYLAGLDFGEMSFDDVFAGLKFEDGFCTARILDTANNRSLTLRFDDGFRECVVYNPPHREAVCIEPYTCVPNAPELTLQGVDAGLRILAPGESLQTRVEMHFE